MAGGAGVYLVRIVRGEAGGAQELRPLGLKREVRPAQRGELPRRVRLAAEGERAQLRHLPAQRGVYLADAGMRAFTRAARRSRSASLACRRSASAPRGAGQQGRVICHCSSPPYPFLSLS